MSTHASLSDALLTSVLLLPVILGFITTPDPATSQCRLSEFPCTNKRCIPLSYFCNSVDDCGDSSDEPRFCTQQRRRPEDPCLVAACNRTYYGDLGKTYELELHRPREDRLPFFCQLTLSAGSGDLGDIVQVTFESFTLGRFTSFLTGGCPDGDMQLWEWNRPRIGGAWCGTSWGPSVYYSETRSVTVSLTLRRISKDQDGHNFDFRISYKTLPKHASIVRYGGLRFLDNIYTEPMNVSLVPTMTPQHYLGDLIGGTFCSRVFTDCNRKDCRLQSPNYPGVYPRNLTCYYAIRQQEVPPGKYALISVRQPKGQLVNIRSQAALYARANQQPNQSRQLKVWKDCDEVQDYVTVYDGYTTRDPVLLKFCGGGVAVPEAISSTHELLVEFSTSPYGTFLYPSPPMPLHGFQLQVQVKFVDKESPKYSRNKRCEFWLKGAGKGVLESPRHSLSANTTCLYHLQGMEPGTPPPPRHLEMSRRRTQALVPSRFKVWLAVLKYHVTSNDEQQCSTRLQVWDGNIRAAPSCNEIYCEKDEGGSLVYSVGKNNNNLTLLARYCKDHIPRSCDHSLLSNGTRAPRPCSLAESFLSSGDSLTLELRITQSTALRPVSFRALYEFVDLHQDGEAYGNAPCSRRFTSRTQHLQGEPQNFTSPRDVFLFGRGGNTNLSCVYRFEAQRGESVRITVHGLQTANRSSCVTRNNPDSSRLQCVGNATAHLRIWEVSWSTAVPLPRDCLCGGSDHFLPFTFTSTAHIVEVHFNLLHMTSFDDFRSLNFHASWEFVRTPVCTRKQRIAGISGELLFRSPSRTPDEVNCEGQPWLITPMDAKYLYVQLRGTLIQGARAIESNASHPEGHSPCPTKNRVLVHAGGGVHVLVCPLPVETERHHLVEVFSEGWVSGHPTRHDSGYTADSPQSRSVLVEFLPREPGLYSVTWMEISRRALYPHADLSLSDCQHRCPELDACINSSLWCDGVSHCPSGFDEALTHCLYLLQLPPLHLALVLLGLLVMAATLLYVLCRLCRARHGSRLKSLPSDTEAIVGTPKEVIC